MCLHNKTFQTAKMSMESDIKKLNSEKIAIIGSGLIGRNWAMIFAASGYEVNLFDIEPSQVSGALVDIRNKLEKYEQTGHLRGTLSVETQMNLIQGSTDLAECLQRAIHIQECVPESVELKKKVFVQLDRLVGDQTVLASSSSCISSSNFSSDLNHRANVLVAHPVNPPYFLPLVELVPAPWTDPGVVTRTRDLMETVGQSPITLNMELPGFALNRIQYAVINECWHLVQSGALTAVDVDKVMTQGLGLRYAFIGPLETMRLNANGVVDYCERYAQVAHEVCQTMKPPVLWDVPSASKIEAEFSKSVPLDKLKDRLSWRDERIASLVKLKQKLD